MAAFFTKSSEEETERLYPSPLYLRAVLDASKAGTKSDFLKNAGAAFGFPESYVANWDAFLDCLRSLYEENPRKGYVMAVKNSSGLLAEEPEEFENLEDVFKDADECLRADGAFLKVLYWD